MINKNDYLKTKVQGHIFQKKIKILFLKSSVTKIYKNVGNLNNQDSNNKIKIFKNSLNNHYNNQLVLYKH